MSGQPKRSPPLRLVHSGPRIPVDSSSEQLVLGGILLNPNILEELLADGTTRGDFHIPKHERLWDLILTTETPDLPAILGLISQSAELADSVGGVAYVAHLPGACPALEGVLPRAKALRNLRLRREVQMVTAQIAEWVDDPLIGGEELLARAESKLSALSAASPGKAWTNSMQAVEIGLLGIQKDHEAAKSGKPAGVTYPWKKLAELTGALVPGDLIVVAARPAMGKSAFAQQLCNMAAEDGFVCGFVSMEMPIRQLANRALVYYSGVPAARVRDAKDLTGNDWDQLSAAGEQYAQLSVYLDYAPGVTLSALRGKIFRLKAEATRAGKTLGLVVVDYLGLMTGQGPKETTTEFLTTITKTLKRVAGEAGVALVLLSQLNRKVEERADKTPQMADLRDSGSIEQDADQIIFLLRDHIYDEDAPKDECHIIVAKCRNGTLGRLTVRWDGPRFMFGAEVEKGGFR